MTLLGGASVWWSYPAAFVVGGIGLVLGAHVIRRRQRAAMIACTLFVVVSLASFAAMATLVAAPQSEAFGPGGRTWINAWPPLNWRLPGWLLDIHAGNMMAYPVGGKNFGSSLTLLAAIVGSAALWRRRRRPLLGLMLLPALLTLMAALAGRYPYGTSARVAQHMAPAICLLAGAGTAALLGRLHGAHRIRSVFIFTGVMGLIVLVGMATDVARPTKEPSVRACRDALRDLAEKTDPRDRWVVFNALEPVDYAPQLKEAKGSGATFLYYIRHLAPVSVAWAPPPERVNMPAGGRVWVIVYHDNKAPTPEHQVDAYVARLSNRLGPPRRHHLWQLGQAAPPRYPYQEKIVAWEFDASPGR